MSRAHRAAVVTAAVGAFAAMSCPIRLSAAPLTIAVADFDYIDTSGEVKDQRKEHQARMAQFAELLRAKLSADGEFQVMPIECAEPPCTPINMQPERFVDASRRSNARYVVYGGIHNMSTLVRWAMSSPSI